MEALDYTDGTILSLAFDFYNSETDVISGQQHGVWMPLVNNFGGVCIAAFSIFSNCQIVIKDSLVVYLFYTESLIIYPTMALLYFLAGVYFRWLFVNLLVCCEGITNM